MKFFVSLLSLLAFTTFFTPKTNAQISVQNIFHRLMIEPIQKDTNGIDFLFNPSIFGSKVHDENTFYMWDAWNTGTRLTGSIEHFSNVFIYIELFYEREKYTDLYASPTRAHKGGSLRAEPGVGMRFPVEIGETGLLIEGEATMPFSVFRPALEAKLKWENEKVSVGLGNKIVTGYASLFNPTIQFEYKFVF